ncbi:MAG TPA: AraC family transcriptional regulator [Puia sp.]|nr:AraC family transcriptional regulator [Puia sp.]
MSSYTYTLINPHNSNLAFKAISLDHYFPLDILQRVNYYSLILLTEGSGRLQSDFSEYSVSKNSLLCFAPYQPFRLTVQDGQGWVINFHPDFFCIHKHHQEVACHGILFNNIYEPPFHALEETGMQKLQAVIADMQLELQQEALAQHELLVSLLKIFLITASRSKADLANHQPSPGITFPASKLSPVSPPKPFVLQKLKDAIELHYRQLHSAGKYAEMLNISPKALAKITKHHFSKTITEMISERIVIEAKRELYLTSKLIKTIAYELGFEDEHHFSRFFKNKTEISPQLYRQQVGFAKGET